MPPSSSVIHLRQGDILYRQGDPNDTAYIVDQGEVILWRQGPDGRSDIEIRGHGAVIGEFSILTDRPRTVTAEARTDCQILRLPADKIYQRFERLDPILKACVETSIGFNAKLNSFLSGAEHTCEFVQHAPPVPGNLIERLRLGTDISTGLRRNQFFMVYQPIVQLSDSNIVGFEALMRWSHPILGQVAPDRFIAVAEELETIGSLTEFALSQACNTLREMCESLSDDTKLYMSVNVSGVDCPLAEVYSVFVLLQLWQWCSVQESLVHQVQPLQRPRGDQHLIGRGRGAAIAGHLAGDELSQLQQSLRAACHEIPCQLGPFFAQLLGHGGDQVVDGNALAVIVPADEVVGGVTAPGHGGRGQIVGEVGGEIEFGHRILRKSRRQFAVKGERMPGGYVMLGDARSVAAKHLIMSFAQVDRRPDRAARGEGYDAPLPANPVR